MNSLYASLEVDRISVLLQRFVQLFLREETVRVITAGNAILQKSHMFEVLLDLQSSAAAAVATASTESQQVRSHTYKCTVSERFRVGKLFDWWVTMGSKI